jgi:hypothetical protein
VAHVLPNLHLHLLQLNAPATIAGLEHSAVVRFSLLAFSSIFFLVDPFAALPTFLAITAGADARRTRAIARKASITALVVLSAFAGRAVYLSAVRHHVAGLRDLGRHHPAADRPGYVEREALGHAGDQP